VHFFADSAVLARHLARELGLPARQADVHRFPDGESLVTLQPTPGETALLVRSLDDPNAKLVEVLLAADALRRAGARHVVLVAPYLAYMRQDAVFRPGEPVSQQVVAGLLGRAFDRVLTVEAHLHRTPRLDRVFPCAARSLAVAPVVGDWCAGRAPGSLVVGPDEESEPWVRAIARRAGVPWVVAAKRRKGDRSVRVDLPPLPRARRALLVDDIASTGATLAAAARELHRRGVRRVEAVVVHPIFARGALARLERAGVSRVVSCDTISHASNRIRVAPLLARALGRGSR
jgi:ribose-phosphate pyrophosphokinase